MPIREVVEAFDEHTKHIPFRLIDLYATPICLAEREAVKQQHATVIESITEADLPTTFLVQSHNVYGSSV